MALLKAFVCQVVLFGLYKLFLEEVVEAHLVPDELTRNCIVGFVCLMCFGIQLYTDIPDEDYAEADENPKSDSTEATSTKKSEPPKIPATRETVGSNTTNRATANTGVFAQFSPNIPDGIKVNGRETPDVPVKTPYSQKVTDPVLNGYSDTRVCEELEDDVIEIDKFVAKQSDQKKVEQFKTAEVKEVEPIKAEVVTEEVKKLAADEPEDVEVIKSKEVVEDVNLLRINEDEAIKPEEVTAESKCLIVNVRAEEVKSKTVESGKVEPIKGEDVTEPGQSSTADVTELGQLSTVEAEDVTEPGQLSTLEAEDVTEPEKLSAVEAEGVTELEQLSAVEAEGVTELEQLSAVEAEGVIEPEQLSAVEAEGVTESEQSATDEDEMVIKSVDITDEVSHSKINEEAIKPEVTEATVLSKCLVANGKAEEFEVFNPQSEIEEVKQSTAIENEVETTQSEAVVDSECLLANGNDNFPTPDSDKTTNLNIGESSEAQMANGIGQEPLNTDILPNIIQETKNKSVKDQGEIGNGQETTLSPQPNEYTNDTEESIPSPTEISNTISISTKVVNDSETDKNNGETTTLVVTAVPPSEKLAVTSRQKTTIAEGVCVAPITIDISFIYACH